MNKIHPTAVIDDTVVIGTDVEIGPYCHIGRNVEIGDGCVLESNVRIGKNTKIGKGNFFSFGAVIGTDPQDLKFNKDDETYLEIGDNNTFREFCTINRSATTDENTTIGSNCLIMAYVHVAHNCHLGNNIILANSVQLAGHIIIDDFASVGGTTAVHQFVRIGKYCFVGGASAVKKDVPPYTRGEGMPYRAIGLNSVGLQRKGFTAEQISAIKDIYKIFYQTGLNASQALSTAKNLTSKTPEQQEFIDFVENATRGICRG